MRIQSRHATGDRYLDLDAYMSSPVAVQALIRIEAGHIPQRLWEPCAGDHTGIADPLTAAGFEVETSDIEDYGRPHSFPGLILEGNHPPGIGGIVTNPPYKLARDFIEAALAIVPYSAWLLRTNFLESTSRLPFFRSFPPSRVWISSRRLPMMHRYGWSGPQAASNTAYAWFILDEQDAGAAQIKWFDFKEKDPNPVTLPAVQAPLIGEW
jgi:hypothetical protein